jgi:hypothetical protein
MVEGKGFVDCAVNLANFEQGSYQRRFYHLS